MTTIEITTTPDVEDRVSMAIQRWAVNMLGFPHLCVKTACRRADTCSADPDICIGRLAPLLPENVRDGIQALFEGKFDGLTYDEVRAGAPLELRAFEEWLGKIGESRRASAPMMRPKTKKSSVLPTL